MSINNSNDTIGNRTSDLRTCSAVPQPTAPPRAPHITKISHNFNQQLNAQIYMLSYTNCRSQWPRGLRRRSAAARLLRSWDRIPPAAWKFVCCECCVLSGRGLCDELITRPEKSYRLCCVVVCDLENLKNEEAVTGVGSQRHSKTKKIKKYTLIN